MKILISPGYGSGWSTWAGNGARTALTWPPLIRFLEEGGDPMTLHDEHPAIAGLLRRYPEVYVGSNVHQLEVVNVRKGTRFRIHEYDGHERVETTDGMILATR